MSEFCSFWGSVLLMQRMMLSFCTGISFTPPFLGETASWMSTHGKKNLCKRDVSGGRVFLRSSWVLPGEHWSVPTIDMMQLIPSY